MCIVTRIVYNKMFARQKKRDPSDLSVSKISEKLMAPGFRDYIQLRTAQRIALMKLPFDRLSLISRDGLRLAGFMYRNPVPSRVTFVFIHGYGSSGFEGASTLALLLIEAGYNVFFPDNRAAGESEGDINTFGILESRDTRDWLRLLAERFPEDEFLLYGNSLGGSTVCMLADAPLPDTVRGIVSDCAFADLRTQLAYSITIVSGMPARPILDLVALRFRRKTGLTFDMGRPIDHVSRAKLPMLFIHGEKDVYVPPENAVKLHEACATGGKLLMVPGAGHAAAVLRGSKVCMAALREFVRENCTNS